MVRKAKEYTVHVDERQTTVKLLNSFWEYVFLVRGKNDIHATGGAVAFYKSNQPFDPFWVSSWITSGVIPDGSELVSSSDWRDRNLVS